MIAAVIKLSRGDNLKFICWLLRHTVSKSKSKFTSGKKKAKAKNTVQKEKKEILEVMIAVVINVSKGDNLKIIS